MSVETPGLDRLLLNLEAMLNAGADAGSDVIVEGAKQRVPVGEDVPHLRDTIQHTDLGAGIHEVSAGDGLGDARAIYVELGTSRRAAEPYLMPAATDPAVFAAFAAAVKDNLK